MCDLSQLLEKLNGAMFAKFISEHGLTVNSLKYVSGTMLETIIPTELYGQLVGFQHRLQNWQSLQTTQSITNVKASKESPIFDILKSTANGKIILEYFETMKKLTPKLRKLLSSVLTEYFLNNKLEPTRKMFQQYAEQIVLLFPSEAIETYYIANNNKKPKGSLYAKYHNTLYTLRKTGALQTKKPVKSADENLSGNEVNEFVENISDENASAYRTWLKYNVEPLDEILMKWTCTFAQRFSELRSNKSLHTIFDEWPLYKQSFGHALIDIDFKAIFPGKENKLFENWDSGCNKLIVLMNERIKDHEGNNFLKRLKTEEHSLDVRSCIVVVLLHCLLVPTVRKVLVPLENGQNRFSKPTVIDSRNTFLIKASTTCELKSIIKETTDSYFSQKRTIQPIICGIGEDFFNLKHIYVYFGNIFYKFKNIVKALDICFKVYHVLNLEFPGESKLVWLFIQQFFYGMCPKSDERSSSVYTLISDLNNLQL